MGGVRTHVSPLQWKRRLTQNGTRSIFRVPFCVNHSISGVFWALMTVAGIAQVCAHRRHLWAQQAATGPRVSPSISLTGTMTGSPAVVFGFSTRSISRSAASWPMASAS